MRGERGSLLIELLVGTGLLAVILFASFQGLVALSDELGINRQRAVATTVAANTLTALRAQPYEALTVGQTTVPVPDLPSAQVSTTISQAQDQLYDVEVTVVWADGPQTRSVTSVTKVANDGLEAL